jgi:hypothetical protein
MICYRDKTFCTANCANLPCTSKLTDEVRTDAEKWWGQKGAPIAVSDFSAKCPLFVATNHIPDTGKMV